MERVLKNLPAEARYAVNLALQPLADKPTKVRAMLAVIGDGWPTKTAARVVHIGYSTACRWLAEDPQALEEAKAEGDEWWIDRHREIAAEAKGKDALQAIYLGYRRRGLLAYDKAGQLRAEEQAQPEVKDRPLEGWTPEELDRLLTITRRYKDSAYHNADDGQKEAGIVSGST